jgi:hypothetical protein
VLKIALFFVRFSMALTLTAERRPKWATLMLLENRYSDFVQMVSGEAEPLTTSYGESAMKEAKFMRPLARW